MLKLISDQNLESITFSEDGRSITLHFLNMSDGNPSFVLILLNVTLFNFSNTFSENDDGFPVYIGEVNQISLDGSQKQSSLGKFGYDFLGNGVSNYIPKNLMNHIHVEGGELVMDVLCGDYELTCQP